MWRICSRHLKAGTHLIENAGIWHNGIKSASSQCQLQCRNMCISTNGQSGGNDMSNAHQLEDKRKNKTYSPESSTNIILGWGSNITRALGDLKKTPEDVVTSPQRLDTLKPQIAASGNNFSVIVSRTTDNVDDINGCGINTQQQLGHIGSSDDAFARELSRMNLNREGRGDDSDTITSVACGGAHTWIATDKTVHSLGNNAQGQCGHPITSTRDGSTEVPFGEQIKQIVCGVSHTLVLTMEGHVFSCGLGADGQTGLGHFKTEDRLSRVCGDIEQEKITAIASRADCSLAISESGEVFGWGNSEYGQLAAAVGDVQQVCVPRHLPVLAGERCVGVAAAGTMCSLITDKGLVYVWGYGILGLSPEIQEFSQPQLISPQLFSSAITQIDSGINHFAAVSDEGELYMWSKQKHGCLGGSNSGDKFIPTKVDVKKVEYVSCGYEHTLVMCDHL